MSHSFFGVFRSFHGPMKKHHMEICTATCQSLQGPEQDDATGMTWNDPVVW
jgi:hypothetical protein